MYSPCNLKNHIKSIKPHATPNVASAYFTAKDVGNIYNITGNATTRKNIAIIELGGGYKPADLQAYWTYLGLLIKPNVFSVPVDGATNSPGQEADYEVVLDIEVIGGICPNSNIYVYFAPNTYLGFYHAILAAISESTHPYSVISISWGGPENTWPKQTMITFDNLFQFAVKKGITICVASGDNGSSDGERGLNVDFPSSSPNVLACGGTHLVCPTKNYGDKTTNETVWGGITNDGAAGGGYSAVFSRPSFQTISNRNRGVPDVCGNADPETGWIIYINGGYTVIGGTSAVAPMWAGYLAYINCNKFASPLLYSNYNKNILHDILKGTDGSYSATIGWDCASGLGSPNGINLSTVLK